MGGRRGPHQAHAQVGYKSADGQRDLDRQTESGPAGCSEYSLMVRGVGSIAKLEQGRGGQAGRTTGQGAAVAGADRRAEPQATSTIKLLRLS